MLELTAGSSPSPELLRIRRRFEAMKLNSSKGSLIWGSLLIIFGGILLAETFVNLTVWIWVAALAVSGLIILGIFLTDTSQRWILIPAYVLFAISGLIALIELDILQDEFIATYVLTIIALPFLTVYLRDRKQWWALVPAYILLAVGIMIGLIAENILTDLLIPAYVLLSVAFPFFVVYIRDTKQWWALIPGGIIGLVGVSFLLAEGAFQYIIPAVVILAGVWILTRQFINPKPRAVEGSTSVNVETDETTTD
jgi:hypothetical protein